MRINNVLLSIFIMCSFSTGVPLPHAQAYPLDAYKITPIQRLEGYYHLVQNDPNFKTLPRGARMHALHVSTRMQTLHLPFPKKDTVVSKELQKRIRSHSKTAAVAVLDFSYYKDPQYWAVNEQRSFIPGSVGKVLIANTLLNRLAAAYPDIEKRLEVLSSHQIEADPLLLGDSHEVPFWNKEGDGGHITHRPIEKGDRANLYTYLDWMLSASSNAAANVLQREIVLLQHFGSNYPPSAEEASRFLDESPAHNARLLRDAHNAAMKDSGISSAALRQTSLFSRNGRTLIPGSGSTATPESLVQLLFRLEQGRLTDPISSNELKRLLYLTQKRSRYVRTPTLANAAVYAKSGSLYSCSSSSRIPCSKYHGTARNIMNSIAIIETPVDDPVCKYMVAVSTNDLGSDSRELHHTLADTIHEFLKEYGHCGTRLRIKEHRRSHVLNESDETSS